MSKLEQKEYTEADIAAYKKEIDSMSYETMAWKYRFSPSGCVFFRNDLPLYDYFMKRFKSFGGMTSEISKKIGW